MKFKKNGVRCKVCGMESVSSHDPTNNFESMKMHIMVIHGSIWTKELSERFNLPRDYKLEFKELLPLLMEREKLLERISSINKQLDKRYRKEVEVMEVDGK